MAKLSAGARKAMPKTSFAIPSKAPGPGSYPIGDKQHAANALGRVEQHGTSAEKGQVKAAVARKFPSLGKGKK